MGKPAARIGDMHVCPKVDPGPKPHVGGPVAGGSGDVLINGHPVARVGDKLVCCGPPDIITEGVPTVLVNGKPIAVLGGATAHGGKITLGSPNVLIGTEPPDFGGSGGGQGTDTAAGAAVSGVAGTGSADAYQNPRTYVDPDTAWKNDEPWRKPKVNGNTVQPHRGTRPPDDAPITIINYDQRGKADTLPGKDGMLYTVTRDENGFPVFTLLETFISDEHIGTKNSDEHFKAANNRMKTLLTQNPGLAGELGLIPAQIKFFMRKTPSKRNPPGLTWHHHQDAGKMQLVNTEQHRLFPHIGGMAIWGGGRKRGNNN